LDSDIVLIVPDDGEGASNFQKGHHLSFFRFPCSFQSLSGYGASEVVVSSSAHPVPDDSIGMEDTINDVCF
jgi:hypothetical protein